MFRTGTAWRDVPERYRPWATLHTRFRRWALDGTFPRMLRAAKARADAAGNIDWRRVGRLHRPPCPSACCGARKRGSVSRDSDAREVA
ncbi:transposase [Streptomyces tricolor]|uniref:transposase n=1 Tax=Streptomyces tricolor TaxID=68277 RepID=UPI0039DFB31E